MKPSGYVIYRGPSMLDGAPIVCIATMKSDNRKTGNMVQTWILCDDLSPVDASKAHADASVCGDCKHRWALGGACYVNLGQGPRAVWEKYKRGAYPDLEGLDPILRGYTRADIGAGRMVRLGAYGDPAAVPVSIWRQLLTRAAGHTGYTHQWRLMVARPLRSLVMASVDDESEHAAAQSAGWRTFRVRSEGAPLLPNEFECVADTKGTACADCLACDGATEGRARKASVAIVVHGSLKSRFQQVTSPALAR